MYVYVSVYNNGVLMVFIIIPGTIIIQGCTCMYHYYYSFLGLGKLKIIFRNIKIMTTLDKINNFYLL